MRSTLLIVVVGIFNCFSFAPASTCTSLVAYGNPEYPPYLWRASDKDNLLTGANVEFLDLISKEIDIPIQVRYGGTWARVHEEARQGRVDLIAGAFLTSERELYLDFLKPAIVRTQTVIWVHEDSKIIYKQWADLIGLHGVSVINNSSGEKFDKYISEHLKVTSVASLPQAFDMLKNKRVQYLVYDEWPARAYILRFKIKGVIALQPEVADELLYLAMAKSSPCNNAQMQKKITDALRKVNRKNLMPALLKKNAKRWNVEGEARIK